MVIAMLAPGNSVHTLRWANAFAEHGHTVHLVTQHAPLNGFLPVVKVHLMQHGGGLGYAMNGARFRSLLRVIGPDVVNAHYASGYGLLARWSRPFPLVLNVWGSDVFEFPGKSAMHRWLLRKNLAVADRIVSTSEAMARQTRKFLASGRPINVVPFGVDMKVFAPAPAERRSGPVTIGTVKTLEPVYGVDVLLEAFIALCGQQELPELRLHLVGSGSREPALRRRADDAGVAGRVFFKGHVPHDRVPEELHQLDIYAALSRAESFGVAVVEASASGLPVVVSRVGGLPEVVQEGDTGILVPVDDAAAAASALMRLVEDPALRTRMGEAGRAFVKERYEWANCVREMLSVLQQTVIGKIS